MKVQVSAQGLVTALAVVLAAVSYVIPGATHAVQEALTLAAGFVATGYVHGKASSAGGQGQAGPKL